MEKEKFDDLSKRMADLASRRKVIRGVAAGILGAFGMKSVADAQQQPPIITQAYCGTVRCRTNPDKCRPGCVCCVYSNNNSRCVPPGQCGGGGVVVGGTPTTTTTDFCLSDGVYNGQCSSNVCCSPFCVDLGDSQFICGAT